MFLRLGTLLLLFCATPAFGDTPNPAAPTPDRAGVQALVKQYEIAWNAHDIDAFGRLLVEDATWVNVKGVLQKGSARIVEERKRSQEQFKDSVWTPQSVDVAMLDANVALVHVRWSIRGDRNPDGSARPNSRGGVLTLVAVKQTDGWKIRAGNNTNER